MLTKNFPDRARDRAARMVAGNWRLRTRLPRVTALALTLGFINNNATDAATTNYFPAN